MGYRNVCRSISILDMILSSFGLMMLLIAFLLERVEPANGNSNYENATALNDTWNGCCRELIIAEHISYGIEAICFLLQLFAAWKLLKGTIKSVSPAVGLSNCRVWRGITIFVIVIVLIDIVVKFVLGIHWIALIPILCYCILHIVPFNVVKKYTSELLSKLASVKADIPFA